MRPWNILGDSTKILKGIFEKQEQFSKRIVFAKFDQESVLPINNETSTVKYNNTTHWYRSGTPNWVPIQRMWVRFSVMLWNLSSACRGLTVFLIIKTSYLQNFDVKISYSKFVGSWWESISGSSWSQVDNITTWQYGMTQFLYATTMKFGLLISIMYYRTKRFFSIF